MAQDAESVFAIKIEADPGEADAMTASLAELGEKIKADTSALSAMQAALRNLKGSTTASVESITQLKDRISLQKSSIAQTQAKYIESGGTFQRVSSGQVASVRAAALEQVAAAGLVGASQSTLVAAIRTSESEIAKLEGALRRMGGANAGAGPEVRGLQSKLESQKATLSAATKGFLNIGGSLDELKGDSAKASISSLSSTVSAAGGPIAGFQGKLGGISKIFAGGVLAGGVLLAVNALFKLGQSAVQVGQQVATATVSLLKQAVAFAQARESELAYFDALSRATFLFKPMAGAAKALQDSIDGVSASSALSRDSIKGIALQMRAMGVQGNNLSAALKSAADVTSIYGEGSELAASHTQQLIMAARMGGAALKNMIDAANSGRNGIPGMAELAKRQMMTLPVQIAKTKESLMRLFTGLNIKPLQEGLFKVTSLFKDGTPVFEGWRQIFSGLFGPIIESAPTAGEVVRRVIIGLTISALNLSTRFHELRATIYNAIANNETLLGIAKTVSQMNAAQATLSTVKIAVYGLGAALGVAAVGGVALAGAMVTMVSIFTAVPIAIGAAASYLSSIPAVANTAKGVFQTLGAMLLAPIALFGAIPIAAIGAVTGVVSAISEISSKWDTLSWKEIGLKLVQGLVSGITGGFGLVTGAVSTLASGAIASFKSALGIKSPSQVFMAQGLQVAKGAEMGIEQGTPAVAEATRMMVPVERSAGAVSTRAHESRAISVSFQAGAIQITVPAGANAEQLAQDLEPALTRLLESVLIQRGEAVI